MRKVLVLFVILAIVACAPAIQAEDENVAPEKVAVAEPVKTEIDQQIADIDELILSYQTIAKSLLKEPVIQEYRRVLQNLNNLIQAKKRLMAPPEKK